MKVETIKETATVREIERNGVTEAIPVTEMNTIEIDTVTEAVNDAKIDMMTTRSIISIKHKIAKI